MSAADPFALQKAVKRRIIDEGLTQRTLCQKLGVGVSSLSRWLNGLTAKMHPEYKAQLDEMCKAWLAGRKPRKLDKKKLCGKGRKRCPACQNIVRSNAIKCTKCAHSFAALEEAKRRQASIKWSEDLTTKSDRSARASVAKRRQRAASANAAGAAGEKKRKSTASSSGEPIPKKRSRTAKAAGASPPPSKPASFIPAKETRAGDEPRDALVDYSALDEGFSSQVGGVSATAGGFQHLQGANAHVNVAIASAAAIAAHTLTNANFVGRRTNNVSYGSPIGNPTFSAAKGAVRASAVPHNAQAAVAAYREDGQAQALSSMRAPPFLTYLNTNVSLSRGSPISASVGDGNIADVLAGSVPGIGVPGIEPSPTGNSSLNGSPMAAGDFMVNNFRHAALFADVLTGVSPTNTGCSPTRYSRGGHHQQSSALEFGEDDGVAQGRPAASSAVVSREKRAQDAQDGGAAASTSWTQGVCV